ncbi:MAG: hypothetical protein COV29_03000 [Candidatus Yanofskybacteria bacterium CG10_big_fil_rev_8_21_14_0_10_36_16]|uniref:SD-repeat containing protein B domain-containing protein n=1 Tax=Candidatus Yanofskybacteria bacterium CG10_big_fil_rev_8_21_14_0_10_36_16 TaxID=1975096 RepID=A0A2J0QAH1_9BACT|nr:MAG: hypothetical protein COV29_03000 [Candidatus Yanofskybacteria bacterium CG10_big_fil_rev_8_21_14_0_10_36_16]
MIANYKTSLIFIIVLAVIGGGIYFSVTQDNGFDLDEEQVNDSANLEEKELEENNNFDDETDKTDIGSICGKITLNAGMLENDGSNGSTPASLESVTLYDISGNLVSKTISDSVGEFEMTAPFGEYVVSVDKYDYSKNIIVDSSECKNINIIIGFPAAGV